MLFSHMLPRSIEQCFYGSYLCTYSKIVGKRDHYLTHCKCKHSAMILTKPTIAEPTVRGSSLIKLPFYPIAHDKSELAQSWISQFADLEGERLEREGVKRFFAGFSQYINYIAGRISDAAMGV
jgi:hypothetical protein